MDETIFHPQGGGQPSDEGTINGISVIKLRDLRNIKASRIVITRVELFNMAESHHHYL